MQTSQTQYPHDSAHYADITKTIPTWLSLLCRHHKHNTHMTQTNTSHVIT